MKKFLLILLTLLAYTGDMFCSPVYAGDTELPSWFYHPSGVIGVSDMNLDKEVAVNQAIIRALFVQAVSENVSVSSVYELYYHVENGRRNSIDNQKSHSIAEFEAELLDYDYDVMEVFYTEYNEAVVMLNVNHGQNDGIKKNAKFTGSYMYYFDGTIRKPEFGDLLSLKMETPDEEITSLEWNATTELSVKSVFSTINDEQTRIVEKYNYYSNFGEILENAVFQNTRHGIWYCLVDTFIQSLTNFMPSKSLISSTNRTISDYMTKNKYADYNDIVQDLVRLTYKTHVYCDINEMSCKNGYVYVDWSVVEAGLPAENKEKVGQMFDYEIEGYQPVVGTDYSKAKNESRRIALICAQNEIAKMANYKVTGTSIDFTMSDEQDYYTRYCDTTQISTLFMMRDVIENNVEEPGYKDGVYCSKIKAMINTMDIIPIKKKKN